MNIFIYGTLMYPDIWERCVRNIYASKDAQVRGFKCLKVKQEVFPALIQSRDHEEVVAGKVYLEVNEQDFSRVKDFIGKHFQVSDGVCFVAEEATPIACKNFIWRSEYRSLLSHEPWEKAWFEEKALKIYRQSLSQGIL
jgi:gamma-glutamylcyclotransferase (GGCT)/AIG2-like uncharacterized protein YtfP